MVALASSQDFTPGSSIKESYRQIDTPTQKAALDLVAFWKARPADGIIVRRDIPSRKIAPLLSHILIWEPVAGEDDLRVHLAGEGLRYRFGGNAVGQRFSALVDPDIQPFFRQGVHHMQGEDYCRCFDMRLSRDIAVAGQKDLHFELVTFPVWSPGRGERWILNGLFYF